MQAGNIAKFPQANRQDTGQADHIPISHGAPAVLDEFLANICSIRASVVQEAGRALDQNFTVPAADRIAARVILVVGSQHLADHVTGIVPTEGDGRADLDAGDLAFPAGQVRAHPGFGDALLAT